MRNTASFKQKHLKRACVLLFIGYLYATHFKGVAFFVLWR